MKISAIIRTVSRDDRSLYGRGIDGKQRFIGQSLRDYQARREADGFVTVPVPASLPAKFGSSLTTAHPAFSVTEHVEHGIDVRVAGPNTVRFSLDRWRDCDPDTTFLLVAFRITPHDDAPGVCSARGEHR